MQDTFGRSINYLRLSVTEACNFNCNYCAPEGRTRIDASPLSLDEITRVVRAAVALGIVNIRLTGGEPLLRRDIVEIVCALVAIPGVRDVALTTNAFRLAELAQALKDAGLARANISLDSLQRERFAKIVGVDAFDLVWRGIETAERVGFAPLKINAVILRDVNDDEVNAFARLSVDRAWSVRFIELMPVGVTDAAREFFARHFVSAREIQARLPALEPVTSHAERGNGPAKIFRLPNARGTIGFITAASDHFCAMCNRIRITARGEARSCLFGNDGFDVRAAINGDDTKLQRLLTEVVNSKPECHPLGDEFQIVAGAMAEIGG
ncbi:MAG: GTP 3',8-cyclase MoaA [Chloroflexi bacterium]|nr:GTP 3',8-cyclase MoaA [Chloroflexota bacterium]